MSENFEQVWKEIESNKNYNQLSQSDKITLEDDFLFLNEKINEINNYLKEVLGVQIYVNTFMDNNLKSRLFGRPRRSKKRSVKRKKQSKKRRHSK